MQNTSELIATLECRGEAVAAQFADGSVQDIPFDLIKRSQLLHAALCESNSEQDLRAGVPQLILQNWLQWRAIGTASDVVSPRDNSLRSAQRVTEQLSAATSDIPVETLVGYLQVWVLAFSSFAPASVFVLLLAPQCMYKSGCMNAMHLYSDTKNPIRSFVDIRTLVLGSCRRPSVLSAHHKVASFSSYCTPLQGIPDIIAQFSAA